MRILHLLFFTACAFAAPLLRQQTPPDVVPDAELLPAGPTPTPLITPSGQIPASPPPSGQIPATPPPSQESSPAPTTPQPSPTAGATPAPTSVASPTASPPSTGGPFPPGGGQDDTDGDSGDGDTGDGDAGDGDTGDGDTDNGDTGDGDTGDGDTDNGDTGDGDTDNGDTGDGDTDDGDTGVGGTGEGDLDGDGEPDEPQPTPFIEGGDSNRAALAGGITGGIFALLLLILCIFCVVFRGKKKSDGPATGVYTSTEAGVEPDGAGVPDEPVERDDTREMDVDVPGDGDTGVGAVGAAGGVAMITGGEEDGQEVVPPRGPTPPPHDYVLGAGPAATRKDFVDLRTKFERDEIGDNSAVLGVDRDGGEGGEVVTENRGVEGSGEVVETREVAQEPVKEFKPESLPDRGGPVAMTFDSQERLMVGGDGSGGISDAAMSLNAASIAEESGDVPSLERDPIVRDRDQTF